MPRHVAIQPGRLYPQPGYSVYRAFYREKYQTTYNDKVIFSHETREFQTAKMHRSNLFKRLDSSVAAFHQTLERLNGKITAFIKALESPDAEISGEFSEESDDMEEGTPGIDYKYDIKWSHLLVEEYLQDLSLAARRYMAEVEQAGAKVVVSNLMVLEAYFACQHHYGMPKDAAPRNPHGFARGF